MPTRLRQNEFNPNQIHTAVRIMPIELTTKNLNQHKLDPATVDDPTGHYSAVREDIYKSLLRAATSLGIILPLSGFENSCRNYHGMNPMERFLAEKGDAIMERLSSGGMNSGK
ncbi:MAG: hypothetical protein MMC33_009357 [Icmadophila ericetorum]|nr:hypothetical protein [Icmadophila ericetorum]